MQSDSPVVEAGVALDAVAQANVQFGALCVAYAKTPLALVMVLEGSVMGGGIGLACVADVALACETAVFRLPETALGVVPAQIAPFLLERLGYSQAKRLAVTGGRPMHWPLVWCMPCTRLTKLTLRSRLCWRTFWRAPPAPSLPPRS
jgi:hypothetical protein